MPRSLALPLLLAACWRTAPPPAQDHATETVVRIDHRAPVVGERVASDVRFSVELAFEGKDGVVVTTNGAWKTQEVIVQVDGDVVMAREVRFVEFRAKSLGLKDGPDMPVALAGKTYRLRWEGDALAYGDVTPSEREALDLYQRHDTGKLHRTTRVLTNRAFTVGTPWRVPEGEFVSIPEARSSVVTLVAADQATATFDVVEHTDLGGSSKLVEARVKVVIDRATGRTLSIDTDADTATVQIMARERFSYTR